MESLIAFRAICDHRLSEQTEHAAELQKRASAEATEAARAVHLFIDILNIEQIQSINRKGL